MTRFADPHRCPDCRAAIAPGVAACSVCALPLRGDLAHQLFVTLQRADDLLSRLRASSVPAPAPGTAPAGPAAPRTPVAAPAAPATSVVAEARRGLAAASVPKILLTLGAGCLLVAALVFLAVAWSVLGVGGRTATLVVLTGLAAGLAGAMARKGLRGAAESLSLVSYGLLTLDVAGADSAGWLGDPTLAELLFLLGTVLAATGAAGALAARRTSLTLAGAEVVAVVGVGLATATLSDLGSLAYHPALVAGTLLAGAAAEGARRLRLRIAAVGLAIVAALQWLVLTGTSLSRAVEHDQSWGALWLEWQVWPLLVSAGLVAAVALVRTIPVAARVAGAAAGHVLLAYALLAPVERLDPTPLALVLLAVVAATGVATWLLPRPWGLVNAATQALAAVGVAGVAVTLAGRATLRLVEANERPWGAAADLRLPALSAYDAQLAGWLLPLCVVALVATAWSLADAHALPARLRSLLADPCAGVGLLVAAVVGATSLYAVPLWVVLAPLLGTGAGFAARWVLRRSWMPLAWAAGFATVALLASLASTWLTLATLLGVLALAALVHLRHGRRDLAALAGGVLAVAAAGVVLAWGEGLDAPAQWVAVTGIAVLGVLALAAPYLPRHWWACAQAAYARTGTEAGAAVGAVLLTLAGAALAPQGRQAEWLAVYLTLAGAVATVMSLLRPERRPVSWAGGGLLAAASWVRLWDLGVEQPEAYTLPSALVLLAAGLLHLRREPGGATLAALAPGLSLALVPSLLWALAEEPGLRALLLGLGCLGLVLSGAALRWTAPLVLGSAVGAVLVLRLTAPYANAVDRWVLIGLAGVVLLTVGATWERRLQEARAVLGYVQALR